MNTAPAAISQTRLRELAWDMGSKYPIPLITNSIALYMVSPHSGHVHWNLRGEALDALKAAHHHLAHAPLIVRIYDVTDIIFDGFNAHSFFDIAVNNLTGNYYFRPPQMARHYMAEIGLRGGDGSYFYIARSNTAFFERDRSAGNYLITGLFVGGTLQRTFPVENIFDAPVYERMNQELAGIQRPETLSAAVVFVSLNQTMLHGSLGHFITHSSQRLDKFGGTVRLFTPVIPETDSSTVNDTLLDRLHALSAETARQLMAAHQQTPLHLIHCHDWYSSQVGMLAARELHLPLILSLHSTEYERTQGHAPQGVSASICEWEQAAIQAADLIIAPHSGTFHQVISLYGAPEEKVVIIPDVFTPTPDSGHDTNATRRGLGIGPADPLVLFAGEISHAAGADLMVDALPQVCSRYPQACFVFAGDGPLKGELEARVWRSGIGQRCRFLGDVSQAAFEGLLLAADFVAIPARTWQGEGLAQMAVEYGKPVLTTHQAGIRCITHGKNGLITYDNPGSMIWGLQEMLANPLQGSMVRVTAKRKAKDAVSLENVVVQHYMYYAIVCTHFQESKRPCPKDT